jgi:hypothetical protein
MSDLEAAFQAPFFYGVAAATLWSVRDFSRPYHVHGFRASITLRRYILGSGIYAVGNVFLYTLFTGTVNHFYSATGLRDHPEIKANGLPILALFFVMLISMVPPFSKLIDEFRKAAQRLAYYPEGLDKLLLTMGSSPFSVNAAGIERVKCELRNFALSDEETQLRQLRRPVKTMQEIESIKFQLFKLLKDDRFQAILGRSMTPFESDLTRLELRCQQLYKRIAQLHAGVLALDNANFSASYRESEVVGYIAQPIEEYAANVREKYRKIVAKVATSEVHDPEMRSEFLRAVGYGVPARLALPFWPIIFAFLVVLIGMSLPVFFAPSFNKSAYFPGLTISTLSIIAIMQAVKHSLALIFATNPKFYVSSARPSLRSLPINSYLLFGSYSFLACFVITLWQFTVFPRLPIPVLIRSQHLGWSGSFYLALAALVLSFTALIFTLVVSVLIDLRLLKWFKNQQVNRTFDALVGGVAVGLAQIFMSGALAHIMGKRWPACWEREASELTLACRAITNLIPASFADVLPAWYITDYTFVWFFIGFFICGIVPAITADLVLRRLSLDTPRIKEPPRAVIERRTYTNAI